MNDKSKNNQPPEDDEGWEYIWDGASKAKLGWIIVGPIHAVVSNWKALAVIGALVVWINRPEIINALRVIFGGGK